VLGRIGTGAAVAALPLAALLWAASSSGRFVAGIVSAVLLVSVLATTFAPWVPHVGDRLPGARRIAQLEAFWVEGHKVTQQEVNRSEDLPTLRSRTEQWTKVAGDWIEGHISAVEAERFRRPTLPPYPSSPKLSIFHAAHQHAVARIEAQLDVLTGLRDEQRRRMR
jgi:hypothetical protein